MQKKATNTRRKVRQKLVATARSKRNSKATKPRTEYRTAAGKKRYLKRKADGTIADNQSYKKAHGQDVKRRSKAERTKKAMAVVDDCPVGDGGRGAAAQEHEDRFLKETGKIVSSTVVPTEPCYTDDDDLPLDGPPSAGIVEDDEALSEQRAANFASGDAAADAIDQSLDVELDEDEDDDTDKVLGG